MADLWPWLAMAGLGALHGLSPVNGWVFAAACGVQAGDEAQVRRALWPIAFGQIASMAVLACAISFGLSLDRAALRYVAVGLLVVAIAIAAAPTWCRRQRDRRPMRIGRRTGHAGIALWSFLTASAQGAGVMLVPALAPLCGPDAATRTMSGTGALAMAFAAVAVHTSAMLLSSGVVATGVCRGAAFLARSRRAPWFASGWPPAPGAGRAGWRSTAHAPPSSRPRSGSAGR